MKSSFKPNLSVGDSKWLGKKLSSHAQRSVTVQTNGILFAVAGYYRRPSIPEPALIDQDICTKCALSWIIVVSEWRSVIAVSLNVGGGVRLIKPAKLYMCMQTHYKHDKDRRTALVVRGHSSTWLSHLGNIVTRIGLHRHSEAEEDTCSE